MISERSIKRSIITARINAVFPNRIPAFAPYLSNTCPNTSLPGTAIARYKDTIDAAFAAEYPASVIADGIWEIIAPVTEINAIPIINIQNTDILRSSFKDTFHSFSFDAAFTLAFSP